jgi:polysaccharide export outer membrane protein
MTNPLKSYSSSKLVTMAVFMLAFAVCQAQERESHKTGPETGGLLDSSPGSLVAAPVQSNRQTDDYVIGNEDILAISVWKESEISRTVPVRSDGKISLPLVGEILATGKTTTQLQDLLTTSLRPYISEPAVTVIVQEMRSKKFNILGHVQKPGAYAFSPPLTVVDAIALAGGFRDFAKSKNIYILRTVSEGEIKRLPFNYKEVVQGIHQEQNILLQTRDTIVVP